MAKPAFRNNLRSDGNLFDQNFCHQIMPPLRLPPQWHQLVVGSCALPCFDIILASLGTFKISLRSISLANVWQGEDVFWRAFRQYFPIVQKQDSVTEFRREIEVEQRRGDDGFSAQHFGFYRG